MSESLNIGKTGNYEARVKAELATVSAEADRQREIWNLSNEAQKSLRETAGRNANEPIRSVVNSYHSNVEYGCVEPVTPRRRQQQMPVNPEMVSAHPGVTGLACGECYSREDGRDCIAPVRLTVHMDLIKRSNADSIHVHGIREVRMSISGSETTSYGMQPVRQVRSSSEISVMEMDAKEPDFCSVFQTVYGNQSCPNVRGRA